MFPQVPRFDRFDHCGRVRVAVPGFHFEQEQGRGFSGFGGMWGRDIEGDGGVNEGECLIPYLIMQNIEHIYRTVRRVFL